MSDKKFQNEWPADEASFVSKLFFTWTWPLFRLAGQRTLTPDDLYRCSKSDETTLWSDKLKRKWESELKNKKKPSLFWAVMLTFGPKLLLIFLTIGIYQRTIIPLAQAFFLGMILDFLSGKMEDYQLGYLSMIGFCLCAVSLTIAYHLPNYTILKMGQALRVSVQKMMVDKLMAIDSSTLHNGYGGQLINLISNDVSRFDTAFDHSTGLFLLPLQIILISLLLWNILGYAYLVGVIVIIIFLFLQAYLGPKSGKVRGETAAVTDQRISLMSQIINGMKVIKMYTWEKPFAEMMKNVRRKEAKNIRKACMIWAINLSLSFILTRVILFLCLITYVLMGNELTAKTVFVTIALLNILKTPLTSNLPIGFAAVCESYASLKRIQRFLQLEEISKSVDRKKSLYTIHEDSTKSVEITNMNSYWTSDYKESCLQNISFQLSPGELLTVVGPVGSGKTSLLLSLMNEIHVKADCHAINGRLSYAAQEPWILNTSIRENILFGKPYDEERYEEVLHVTTLERDVKIWQYGDNTLAGERGVALSGGQRARVSLARAIYHEADIYLLDDPLSAVDARVAKQIFSKCIKNFLKSKTVILVTHQLHFLSGSSKILILDQGKCEIFDSLDAIFKSNTDKASLLRLRKSITDSSEVPKLRSERMRKPSLADNLRRISLSIQESSRRMSNYSVGGLSIVSRISSLPEADFGDISNEPEIVEEEQTSGSVDGKIYWTYFRAGSGVFSAFSAFLVNIISQVLFSVNDMWLANWTNRLSVLHELPIDSMISNGKNDTFPEFKSNVWDIAPATDITANIFIYFLLVFAFFSTTLLRGALFFQMTYRASITLHDTIFKKILRSPMQMFEENPVGRILNKFSRDLGVLDETLPFSAFDVLLNVLVCLSVLIVVSTVSWYMIIPAIIIIGLVITARNYYIPAARDVKRIECITRSPVYSHVANTVDGLVTIRTFGMETEFQEKFVEKLDDHTATWNILLAVSRGLGIWIEWITLTYIVITTFLIHLMSDLLPAGSAGLALSQLLLMINVIQWTVRESANAEAHMTSVERVLEYTKLDTENDPSDCVSPSEQWPAKGAIEFRNVSMKYPTAPKPSLIDISIAIQAGEKIGVVGRTGAGKSSLLSCLFRLVEPEGVIEIDGIDIKNIPLENLRSKISIIPQDPVLFSGTIRFNLDPFDEHKDVALWETLDDVQLKEAVADLTGDLEHEIREGGDNFSVGQRQLICLARALLRNNKILVIDEGTANVDHKTDHLIQQTIRTKFADCTVLTIAHRLNTIIDSDRILVLEAGHVVEFDEPCILLENDESLFSKLVSKTGPSMSRELIILAKQASERKHNKSYEHPENENSMEN